MRINTIMAKCKDILKSLPSIESKSHASYLLMNHTIKKQLVI